MKRGARLSSAQQWLPGLAPDDDHLGPEPESARRRPNRAAPAVDKLVARAPARVRSLFTSLRAELIRESGLEEGVLFDESIGEFTPSYAAGNAEILRLHLDPVLAATMTLDAGDKQLGRLLASTELSERIKARAVKHARRSGRRVFLAFLTRNNRELGELLAVMRARLAC